MAVTKGHGNPDWTRDEVLLALDLYFKSGKKLPGPNDPRVKQLSALLRSFPYHSLAARQPTFRNPDGVAFKIQNLRQVATGKGLKNSSRVDRQVWAEFGLRPDEVARIAGLIRSTLSSIDRSDDEEEDDEAFHEGRVVTRAHRRRERSPKLRVRLLSQRRKRNELWCEVCLLEPHPNGGIAQEAMFEAHHIRPLADGEARSTRLSDLALLCANCHRLVHKAIADARKWLTPVEARDHFGMDAFAQLNRHSRNV